MLTNPLDGLTPYVPVTLGRCEAKHMLLFVDYSFLYIIKHVVMYLI